MTNSEDAKTVYNSKAVKYERNMHTFRYASSLQQAILSLPLQIPVKAKILELGCGTGITMKALSQKFPDAQIVGMDYAEEMLVICKKKFPNVALLQGDFNQGVSFLTFPEKKVTKLSPASYDLVFSSGAVSEYGELTKVLPFAYSLLKEKGIFVNIGIKRNFVGWIMGKLWHFTAPGKEKFMTACKEAGFSTVEEITISWKHFPTSFVKYCVMGRNEKKLKRWQKN